MLGTPCLIFRPRSCTRWLKVKMTQWQSFEKCCTKASLDNFMYVRVRRRTGGEAPVEDLPFLVAVLILLVFFTAQGLPSLWFCFLLSFQSSEGASPAQQQVALLDLQSALFCSQLEIQKLQRVIRQKERQLVDAKRCVQFVEAAAHEREQQKEASWKHNQVNQ